MTDTSERLAAARHTPGGPPTVLFVNNSAETFTPTHSGAIATCIHEVLRVAPADHEVHVVTLPHGEAPYAHERVHVVEQGGGSRLPDRARRAQRRVLGWSHVEQARYLRQVREVARRLDPDVLVCSNDPELAVMLRRAFPRARVIHWFHNLLVPSDRFRRHFALDRGIDSVAVSDYLARGVEQVMRLEPRSVRTVYNGVDAARFVPAEDKPDGVVTIGYLGRVCVEKGVDTLLRAALVLEEQGHVFRLQVAGDTNWGFSSPGAYRDEVESLVAQLRSRGVEVDATGHVPRERVPQVLQRADVHVVPSRWDEPFGLTLLEGMACGLAAVVPAAGGLPEVGARGAEVFVREDVGDLARALSRLLEDDQRRRALGSEARARAESFSWARTYEGLLGGAKEAGAQ